MTTQRPNSRHHNSAPAVIETLEDRTLLSSIALNSDGQLAVTGSGIGERIAIFYSHSNTRVHAQIFVNNVLKAHKFYAQPDVRSIFVRTLGGNDIVSNNTWITDTIWTGGGNDRVAAGYTTSQVNGGDGDDVIEGRQGDDHLLGGTRRDHILGGLGNDRIRGQVGNDWLLGNDGDDVILGDQGADRIYGHAGNDTIYADTNIRSLNSPLFHYNRIYGGDGNDRIYDGLGYDEIFGQGGNDYINATAGTTDFHPSKNLIYAGDGNDNVVFYSGSVYGGEGDDTIGTLQLAPDGNHQSRRGFIYGGNGNDILNAGIVRFDIPSHGGYWPTTSSGIDIIYGGNGNDRITKNDRTLDKIYAEGGNDTVIAWSPDPVHPSAGATHIDLGEGDDSLNGGNISVRVYAGDGNDRVQMRGSGSYYVGGTTGREPHTNLFDLGPGNDSLRSVSGNDTVYGGDGDDTISTGIGDDQVFGGAGNDVIESPSALEIDPGPGIDTWRDAVWHSEEPLFDPNQWAVLGSGDETATAMNDIQQSNYGNSYFWAALAAIADSGYDLASGIRYLDGNQFEVDIYDGTQWQAVSVEFDWNDPTLQSGPASTGGTGDPFLYVNSPTDSFTTYVGESDSSFHALTINERDFWPLLYWRAWNQLFAGDEGGNPADVLLHITGSANLYSSLDANDVLAKQRIIDAYTNDNPVVVTTTDAHVTGRYGNAKLNNNSLYEIINDHAYAVYAASENWLYLYNPWNIDGLNIDFAYEYDWTNENLRDGLFRIDWSEFDTYFATYSVNGA